MKFISIILLFIFFAQQNTFGQSNVFMPATADSIFYLGDQHFKYKGLDYESARALKKVLNLDPYSDLYESSQQYMRTKRWATALGIFGIGAALVPLDGFGVSEGYVHPVPVLAALASIGGSLLLWKKSRRQLRSFVNDYNHAVYDKYIQDRFMKPQLTPSSQINVGFKIGF
jgi:hypothetical protein